MTVQAPARGSGSRQQLRGRVLLAEDARDTRELIAYTLTRCGAEVTAVENGRQAVDAAMRTTFDLILLDIRMPEMDGLTAAAALRRSGCRSTLIAFTASTSDRERERILTSGFDDFWGKPISLDDLVERVAAYLDLADGCVEGTTPQRQVEPADQARRDRLAVVAADFVASLPMRARAIRAAVEGGDLHRAYELLHQLVGTGGIHGHMSISHQAARLLQIVKNGTVGDVPGELRNLEELIASLQPPGLHRVDAAPAPRQDS